MLKTISISFINWLEYFTRSSCFQIYSGDNNSLLMYACEVINLISEGVTSPYVQEQGGILLKFNIFSPHYVRHYFA